MRRAVVVTAGKESRLKRSVSVPWAALPPRGRHTPSVPRCSRRQDSGTRHAPWPVSSYQYTATAPTRTGSA